MADGQGLFCRAPLDTLCKNGCAQKAFVLLIFRLQLSPEQLAEAKDAFSKLNGTSLSEAVRFYLLHAKPVGGTKPLSEAIEAVLASKKAAQPSQAHIKHLGWSLKKFAADFPKSNVNEIQQHQIEKWLNGKSYSHETRFN
jgi:outer membrane PBP1 activator LpoA protein